MRKNGPKPKCMRRNLISLVWSKKADYSDLILGIPKGVIVNAFAGTWIFRGEMHKIGTEYHDKAIIGNPIGVYDRTKIRHLNQMKEAIEGIMIARFTGDSD